ncbi:hypothetical protein V491_06028 [Pseudogymnoascus sp. VKM F-3775]|nr:hypothetical protein V491_06028 [Pseudogymnoascus sp. VKM F-3775]
MLVQDVKVQETVSLEIAKLHPRGANVPKWPHYMVQAAANVALERGGQHRSGLERPPEQARGPACQYLKLYLGL